jgi:hypothetical protein
MSSDMNMNGNNNMNNNMTQLDYTYEELQGKTVMISLCEGDDEYGYEENKEFVVINSILDYMELESRVNEYDEAGILDEYYLVN